SHSIFVLLAPAAPLVDVIIAEGTGPRSASKTNELASEAGGRLIAVCSQLCAERRAPHFARPAVRVAKITIEIIKGEQQRLLARPCPDWDALAPLFPILSKGPTASTVQSSA